MNTTFNKGEVDVQSSLQSVRHNLIAKHITLQSIKQRQTTTDFTNQLDIPLGLKDLLSNNGFTLDLLLNTESIDLAEALGIDKYVAKIISDVTRRLNRAGVFDTSMTIKC